MTNAAYKCTFCGSYNTEPRGSVDRAHSFKCLDCKQLFGLDTTVPSAPATASVEAVSIERIDDPVNHPTHYTSHPSDVECIDIIEHMLCNLANAIKYLWRYDLKDGTQGLKKAEWYIEREINRLKEGKCADPAAIASFMLSEANKDRATAVFMLCVADQFADKKALPHLKEALVYVRRMIDANTQDHP